jgi:hypothetical protein
MSNRERAIRAVAARLLRERLPEDREYYPKTTPRGVLKIIEKHNEQLRQIVNELTDITEHGKDGRFAKLFDILQPSDALSRDGFRQRLQEAGFGKQD